MSNVVDVPEAVGLVLTLYCCRLLTTLALVNAAKFIAQELGRFDGEDLMDLQRQLEIYQSLRDVPNFDPKEDRVDEWWVKVWDMMEKERGERSRVLIKLFKMDSFLLTCYQHLYLEPCTHFKVRLLLKLS